jgi:hypothetical protein
LSTSHEAVAWGMSGWAMSSLQKQQGPPLAERPNMWGRSRAEAGPAQAFQSDIGR